MIPLIQQLGDKTLVNEQVELPFLQFGMVSKVSLKVNRPEIETSPGAFDLIHALCCPKPGLVLDSLTTLDSNDFDIRSCVQSTRNSLARCRTGPANIDHCLVLFIINQ